MAFLFVFNHTKHIAIGTGALGARTQERIQTDASASVILTRLTMSEVCAREFLSDLINLSYNYHKCLFHLPKISPKYSATFLQNNDEK